MFAARNALLAGVKTKEPVVFKGANQSSTSSVTIPSHAVGDLILIYATAPFQNAIVKPSQGGTVPNWTTLYSQGYANEFYTHIGYAVATATNHTSGTWNPVYQMQCVVLSGQGISPIGAYNVVMEWSNTAIAPAVTMTKTDGTSQLLHFASPQTDTFTSVFSAPAGYTGRIVGSGINNRLATKDVTTSDGSLNMGTTTANGLKICTATIEIIN